MFMRDSVNVGALSEATLLALQEYLDERAIMDDDYGRENWQFNQFWYDRKTIEKLSKAAILHCPREDSKIALISCPSLYKGIKRVLEDMEGMHIEVKVFEYDKKFKCFSPDFVYYNYKDPLNLSTRHYNHYDIIIFDPPYLSEECLAKMIETIRFLGKVDSKIILNTGEIMEHVAYELFRLKRCSFKPQHASKLGNEFICMTNFGELFE